MKTHRIFWLSAFSSPTVGSCRISFFSFEVTHTHTKSFSSPPSFCFRPSWEFGGGPEGSATLLLAKKWSNKERIAFHVPDQSELFSLQIGIYLREFSYLAKGPLSLPSSP